MPSFRVPQPALIATVLALFLVVLTGGLASGVDPAGPEPAVAEPAVAEPVVAEPTVAEPAIAEPTVAEPTVAEPEPAPQPTPQALPQAGEVAFAGPSGPAKPAPAPAPAAPPGNVPPVAMGDDYTLPAGQDLVVTAPGPLGNDSDSDGDTFTWSIVDNPDHAGFNAIAANGGFTLSPVSGYVGTDSFTYQLQDQWGQLSNLATVKITWTNNPPVAGDDFYSSHDGETIPMPGFMSNDSDPDGDTFTATVLDWPNNFAVTSVNTVSGELFYSPLPGFAGVSYLEYQLTDSFGAKSNVATITFTITNVAPVAVDNAYAATSGVPRVVANPGVIGNDSDADGDFMEPVLVTGPAHAASFTLNTPVWGFTYVSEPGFVGTDTFTYRAKDEYGALSNVATVTIVVAIPPNNAPPASLADAYTTYAGQPLTVDTPGFLGNDVDPDGDAVLLDSYDASTIGHGVLGPMAGDGSFTYTPDPGFTGTEHFEYQPKDVYGAQGPPAIVTITVLPTPVDPAPTPTTQTLSSASRAEDRRPTVLPATGSRVPAWGAPLGLGSLLGGVLLAVAARPRRRPRMR